MSKESDFEITHVFAKFFSGLVYFIANKTNNISCFVFIVTLYKIITCLPVYVLQKKNSVDTKNLTLLKNSCFSYGLKFESLVSEASEIFSTF